MASLWTVMTGKKKKTVVILLALLFAVALSAAVYSQVSQNCPIAAYEGDLVRLDVAAYDPDPEIGPAGALILTFGPPFDANGTWQTMKGQRGIFPFWASVSDGDLKTTNHSCVEVLPNNRNPVLQPVSDIYITRGENTEISATCYDPDGDPVDISYRFDGKDVSFIMYEPPGTYRLEIICTDGFGGIDTDTANLHIDMPVPAPAQKPAPKPAQVIAKPKPAPVQKPQEVVVNLPKPAAPSKPEVIEVRYPKQTGPEVVEVRYPNECAPCPANDTRPADPGRIDVVIYDTISPVQDLSNTTGTFVLEGQANASAPAPEAAADPCADGLARKDQITRAMGCC